MAENFVNYQIMMTPENAGLIDKINKLLLGDSYTEEAPAKTSKTKDTEADSQRTNAKAEASSTPSLSDFRAAAKKAKADFGEEFAMHVLKEAGVKMADTLGRSTSSAKAEDYESIIAAWEAGPQESDDLDEDDGLDDDDGLGGEEEAEVDAEAVKTALKAYSKEHGRDEAKAIMTKHGAASLSKVDDLPAAKLTAMMKELV